MTTPSPITRGTAVAYDAGTVDRLARDLPRGCVIVYVGTDPLEALRPGMKVYDVPEDMAASATDACAVVRSALAVMQAIHDRDTTPKGHPLDNLGAGSIVAEEDVVVLRKSDDGRWQVMARGAGHWTEQAVREEWSAGWTVLHREPAAEPAPASPASPPVSSGPWSEYRGVRCPGWFTPEGALADQPDPEVAFEEGVDAALGPHDEIADLPEPAIGRRPYRVGDVIASSDEPEPPRTAVLRHAGEEDAGDTDRMMYGTRGWGWHGWRFGWSWKRMNGFPVTVVSL